MRWARTFLLLAGLVGALLPLRVMAQGMRGSTGEGEGEGEGAGAMNPGGYGGLPSEGEGAKDMGSTGEGEGEGEGRCRDCDARECQEYLCGSGAPFVCLDGPAKRGCNADYSFWPSTPACTSCCDRSMCVSATRAPARAPAPAMPTPLPAARTPPIKIPSKAHIYSLRRLGCLPLQPKMACTSHSSQPRLARARH